MDLIDKNLAGPLGGALHRDGEAVKITHGFNSGGCENYAYAVTADGGALALDTVVAEIAEVDFTDRHDPQWHVIGVQVNYEDDSLVDDHTGKSIPAAYS